MTRGACYGLSKAALVSRIEEFETYFEIREILSRGYGTLSGGQRRHVDIMRALLHAPSLLFLDEPTTGLDPKSRKQVWEYIRFLQKEKGMTIFLTTHYMEETKDADTVVIMDRGKIICQGTPAALKSAYASAKLIWYTEKPQTMTGCLRHWEHLPMTRIIISHPAGQTRFLICIKIKKPSRIMKL